MKKSLLLLLVFTSVLAFSGCKKKSNIQPTTSEAVEETTVMAETEESSTEAIEIDTEETETEAKVEEYLDREASKELICFMDGKDEKIPSSLYTGDAYSIYIIDEGWEHSGENIDGFTADVWKNKNTKKDVLLKVIALKDKNMMEAHEYIKASYSEYGLTEDKQGGLGGMNGAEQMMEARFYNSDDQIYAVIVSYPASEKDDMGVMLYAMADSFKN
ncbi:MAG: hypothetical protein Q4B86_01785 [Eubacteriales bacterium]|nr:hypothetical protein [Eubacteriales bacterium]